MRIVPGKVIQRIAVLVSKPGPTLSNGRPVGPGAYGYDWPDNKPTFESDDIPQVIGFRGTWYVPRKQSLRCRFHSWLISLLEDDY